MNKLETHYKQNYKNLVNLATRTVNDNNKFLAEECVQQAYSNLIYWIEAREIPDNVDFEPYLYRTLFNEIYDCNEREMKRGMSGKRVVNINIQTDISTVTDEDLLPLDIFRRVCLDIIIKGWHTNKDTKKQVLNMYFIEGYSHPEIAELLKISQKTSRNCIYNYLKLLREN